MKQILLALLFCIAVVPDLSAQPGSKLLPSCSYLKHQMRAAKHAIADPAEDNYDMQYLKLDLALTNTSTSISGSATTRAKVVGASMPTYVFELTSLLTIDSVIFNGQNLPVNSSDSIRMVSLPTALSQNAVFTVQVYYHGAPVYPPGFFAGIANDVSPTWGTHVTYTISESYHALGWWPTKQSLTDKLDSTDVWLTVDTSLKAGSNGTLQHVTPVAPGKVRYEWKERFPIDYYLVSFAVAPYVDYSYYMHFTNSNDSMLIQSYVYNNPATLAAFQTTIDSTGMMVDYFSTIYGRYKFWTEKYGHCMAPISGGMEHQTMTTLGNFHGTLVAHELSHQWFGDNVTCGSWADIWMNEGFASYSEYLFVKHFWGVDTAFGYMTDFQNNVYSNATGTVYCDDTTDENRVFDGRLTYAKGACVLHMLHFLSGGDSVYFQVCKNYQQQNSGGNGTTTTLKNTAEAVLGQNLDTFFTQWVYKEGWPIYSLRWAQAGNQIVIRIDQSTAIPSSVQAFATPIELKLTSASGDTIIKVYNNASIQHYLVNWNKTMTGLQVDPNDWLLKQVLSISNDPSLLHTSTLIKQELAVSPNPASEYWLLTAVPGESHLQLHDLTGRTVWQGNNLNAFSITIPAANLPAGFYILQLTAAGKTASVKLVKQ
jgi:aminopeptidase N